MPKLKELRRYRFMSQVDLARKAGVDSITISRLERGIQKPSLQTVRKLTDALEIEVADIEFQQWPEEEDYWKDLQLPPKLKEKAEDGAEAERQRLEAGVNVITIEGELADRLRSQPHPKEEPEPNLEVEREQAAPAQIGETKPEAETEVEPRASLAAPTSVVPFSVVPAFLSLGNWGVLLLLITSVIGLIILLKRDQKKNEATSAPKWGVKTSTGDPVRDFLDDYSG